MTEHQCNTCDMKNEESLFTKFGEKCAECKKKRLSGKREDTIRTARDVSAVSIFQMDFQGKDTRKQSGT